MQTINCGSHAAVTNGAAVLWIYSMGTSRSTPVTTGAAGTAVVNFTPLAGEVGLVQYAAALPGQSPPAAQGSFTLVGMSQSPASLTTVLTVGQPQTVTITLTNQTSVPLSRITANVSGAPADLSAQVSVPGTLPANGSVAATLTLSATGVNPGYAQFNVQFTGRGRRHQ